MGGEDSIEVKEVRGWGVRGFGQTGIRCGEVSGEGDGEQGMSLLVIGGKEAVRGVQNEVKFEQRSRLLLPHPSGKKAQGVPRTNFQMGRNNCAATDFRVGNMAAERLRRKKLMGI